MWIKYCETEKDAIESVNHILNELGYPARNRIALTNLTAICTFMQTRGQEDYQCVLFFYRIGVECSNPIGDNLCIFDEFRNEWSIIHGGPTWKSEDFQKIPLKTVLFLVGKHSKSKRFAFKWQVWKTLTKPI
jgi:hypothetical protein